MPFVHRLYTPTAANDTQHGNDEDNDDGNIDDNDDDDKDRGPYEMGE